ncbi:DUF2489 domain-containing protein [Halobacteriovorax sp. GFR7]|uniref:DUF2489 domain-containing protein n=1 Tax=unclassified Halobacteriovorax TaxID=2639665 RepID=UPI003720D387
MTQQQYNIAFIILSVLVFILSMGVGFFYIKLKQETKKRIAEHDKMEAKEKERQAFVRDSLITIARAFVQKQCEASEACIRLRMLIDRVDFVENEEYPIIFSMYEEIKHFPTHQARKDLSKQERFSQDKERFAIEDKHMDNLTIECNKLITNLMVN